MPPPFPIDHRISLNRVKLLEFQNETAYQRVGAAALAQMIREQHESLAIDTTLDDLSLRLAFDALVEQGQTPAVHLAQKYGDRFGHVLLVLKRGDAAHRAVRLDWEAMHWDYWAQIRRIWLGGGLVSGALGRIVAQRSSQLLVQHGVTDVEVRLSPYARVLPLVGAARTAPPDANSSLVFDFGGTLIKRAEAVYQKGQLAQLQLLPPIPSELDNVIGQTQDHTKQAALLLDRMIDVIQMTRAETNNLLPLPLLVSMAAYVQNGHPAEAYGGLFAQLGLITDHLPTEMARRLAVPPVNILHDGTAAATVYAGEDLTVVITMGTALGNGFPPPNENLRGLMVDFGVIGL